jgi:hypothetical protein
VKVSIEQQAVALAKELGIDCDVGVPTIQRYLRKAKNDPTNNESEGVFRIWSPVALRAQQIQNAINGMLSFHGVCGAAIVTPLNPSPTATGIQVSEIGNGGLKIDVAPRYDIVVESLPGCAQIRIEPQK